MRREDGHVMRREDGHDMRRDNGHVSRMEDGHVMRREDGHVLRREDGHVLRMEDGHVLRMSLEFEVKERDESQREHGRMWSRNKVTMSAGAGKMCFDDHRGLSALL